MVNAADVNAKIDNHIDVCAVRYEGIELQMRSVNARLKRIEQIMIACAGTLIIAMCSLTFALLTKGH
jgi:lipopolysaccharide/colanic/teichoic acid biosynthesis glycosyltransferase